MPNEVPTGLPDNMLSNSGASVCLFTFCPQKYNPSTPGRGSSMITG